MVKNKINLFVFVLIFDKQNKRHLFIFYYRVESQVLSMLKNSILLNHSIDKCKY